VARGGDVAADCSLSKKKNEPQMNADERRLMGDSSQSTLIRVHQRLNRLLVVSTVIVVIAQQLVVLTNAIRHDPHIGYDGREHVAYIATLSHGRLPTYSESREFFCPPLPYVLPAALEAIGVSTNAALRVALLSQCALSVLLAVFLRKIARRLWPDDWRPALATFALLAVLPVYYKSFAMIRGEPFVAAFTLMLAYYTLRIAEDGRGIIGAGVAAGLLMLSRQWGALPIAGSIVYLLLRWTNVRGVINARGVIAILIGAVFMGGWFYIYLWARFGSPLAFNRSAADFADEHAAPRQLLPPGLFADPTNNRFDGAAWPIFYSDVWGDYWCGFDLWAKDAQGNYFRPALAADASRQPGANTNRSEMQPILARANLLGIPATLAVFAGLFWFPFPKYRERVKNGRLLFELMIWCSIAGYIAFLLRAPSHHGDTVKPTYLLQIFPLLALAIADVWQRLLQRHRLLAISVAILVTLCGIANFPLFFSHYTR
jgi:hypothetical protein